MAKAKKSKTKKSKVKKTKKAKRRGAAAARGKPRKSKPRKAKKAVRKTVKTKAKAVRKAAPKKKQIIGEGDYEGSRRFLKDESEFVKRHSAQIPAMGKEAEAALAGPEGDALRAAEEEAKSHAKTAGA